MKQDVSIKPIFDPLKKSRFAASQLKRDRIKGNPCFQTGKPGIGRLLRIYKWFARNI